MLARVSTALPSSRQLARLAVFGSAKGVGRRRRCTTRWGAKPFGAGSGARPRHGGVRCPNPRLRFPAVLNLVLLARTARSFEDALLRAFPEDGEARETFRMRIENTLFVQLLVGGRLEREGINAKLLSAMALITLAVAPVALLLMFEIKFLPYHSENRGSIPLVRANDFNNLAHKTGPCVQDLANISAWICMKRGAWSACGAKPAAASPKGP
jgi:hypothetical protein